MALDRANIWLDNRNRGTECARHTWHSLLITFHRSYFNSDCARLSRCIFHLSQFAHSNLSLSLSLSLCLTPFFLSCLSFEEYRRSVAPAQVA